MIGAKWFDPVIGIDLHIVLVPAPPSPVPIPVPLPHPFVGLVFDPVGLLMDTAISVATGSFKGLTLTNNMVAANSGMEAWNKIILPHFAMPPGISFAPFALPDNDATIFTGSKTVSIGGSNAARLGDLARSCSFPIALPTSFVIAIPKGAPVLIGGPPTVNLLALGISMLRTKWFSNLLRKILKAKPNSWLSKLICFLTGHPVDVATGMVLTDAIDLELPGPIPLKFERTYYSRSDYEGPLGHGWAHTYDQFIYGDEERIILHAGDGRGIYFDWIEPGQETRNHHERMTLKRANDGFTIYASDNQVWSFTQRNEQRERWYLSKISDNNESAINLIYDAQGYLARILDSAGRVVKLVNDIHGRLTALIIPDPDEQDNGFAVRRYGYDVAGDLVTVVDALDHRFVYKYKFHLMVQETNRNGLSFYFAYDGIDKDASCVHTWGDGGIYDHVITYDKQNHVTSVENSLGQTTVYIMDENNVVVKVVDARGGETTYEYDDHLRKISETDPLGNQTRFMYDELGNTVETIDPDGTKERIAYNEFSLPVEAIDKIGGEWKWDYDNRQRITSRTDPIGNKTKFVYLGKFLSGIVDPAGCITNITIDIQGNLRAVENPDGTTQEWMYNRLGGCHTSIDPNGNRRALWFDLLGRPVFIDEPDANRLQLDYDGEDNVIHAKDTHYDVGFTYGGMNKLISRKQNGTTVDFVYNTEEQLTAIRNEHGSAYTFELDNCGDVITEAGFDGLTRKYARNLGGQVERIDRPGDKTSKFTYDIMGRVTKIAYSDKTSETYIYRNDGELTEATNSAGTVKFERDPLGRVVHEWQNGHRVSSEYDIQGNRIRIHSSLGADQQITRNNMGDVANITYQQSQKPVNTPWETTFMRDKLGLELQREMPGGLTSRWNRDRLGRPISHHITTSANFTRNRTYEWDVNNRLKSIDDTLFGKTMFQHDAFGNLAGARLPDGKEFFRMPDAIGNLFRTSDRSDRKYGPAGQLLEAETKRGRMKYEYDIEGNLFTKTEADGSTWRYFWNGAGMLAKVVRPDGETVLFTYDALGRRISKTYKGKTTRWVWDGNVMLHEWVERIDTTTGLPMPEENDADSRFIHIHYTGRPAHAPPHELQGTLDKPITWLFEPESFTPLARMVGDEYSNIITDHLGTPLAMFSDKGEQVWAVEMDIYGTANAVVGRKTACPFRYPGQYEDEEIELYYNRFRYYDPEGGVYVSQDPIGLAGGMKLYRYVKTTLSDSDPLGLSTILDAVRSKSPINIPDTATYKGSKMKSGGGSPYMHIEWKWMQDGYKMNARYHGPTKGAIAAGDKRTVWVISRIRSGVGGIRPVEEYLKNDGSWIPEGLHKTGVTGRSTHLDSGIKIKCGN